jgi:putative flippase GtrA
MAPDDRLAFLGIPVPAPFVRRLGAARVAALLEFLRFGVVGTLGFLVDAGVLLAAIALGLGPWLGRLVSFLMAATVTYTLNRAWTFRQRTGGGGASAGQWARFVVVNLGGFAANYGTYAVLLATSATVAAWPVLGVAAGSIAGLGVNFGLSRRFVFKAAARAG